MAELKGHKSGITDLCWGEDSETLYSAGSDNMIIVWDTVEGKLLKKLKGHSAVINSISVRNGLILSGSDDCTVKLWDEKDKEPVQELTLTYPITAVALGQSYAFYGGVDNSIKAWNLTTEAPEEFTLLGHADTISGLAIAPGTTDRLLSNSFDSSLKLWDVAPFVIGGLRCLRTFYGHQHSFEKTLLHCSFSADGALISSGSSDNFLYIWDTETGEMLKKMGGHHGSVNETSFHPTQKIVASGSSDKTVIVGEY